MNKLHLFTGFVSGLLVLGTSACGGGGDGGTAMAAAASPSAVAPDAAPGPGTGSDRSSNEDVVASSRRR